MIQDFIKKVGEFHDAFGVKRGNVDVELRYKLFKEEFEEYKDAKTLVDKADAIIDMLYIACGTIYLHELHAYRFDRLFPIKFSRENEILKNIEIEINKNDLNKDFNDLIYKYRGLIGLILDLAYSNNIYEKLPQLFDEVHESNMSKLDKNGKPIINDGVLDPNKPIGKILKGKNYFEPRLKEILENGN